MNTGTITLNSLCSAVSAVFLLYCVLYCIFSFSCVLQLAVLYGTVLYWYNETLCIRSGMRFIFKLFSFFLGCLDEIWEVSNQTQHDYVVQQDAADSHAIAYHLNSVNVHSRLRFLHDFFDVENNFLHG